MPRCAWSALTTVQLWRELAGDVRAPAGGPLRAPQGKRARVPQQATKRGPRLS